MVADDSNGATPATALMGSLNKKTSTSNDTSSTMTYDSLPTSSGDYEAIRREQRQSLLLRLSSGEICQEASVEFEESSHNNPGGDTDGTFLRKEWLDIPSSIMSSTSPSPAIEWIVNHFCCCCHAMFGNLQVERNAVHFGIRMAVLLTISSLFVFFHFQEGMWVLITVLFVCWFPRLDSASVVEKSIQRLIGTFIGAAFALSCGFVSLLFLKDGKATDSDVLGHISDGIGNETITTVDDLQQLIDDSDTRHQGQQIHQAIFLGTCIFVVTFIVGFVILQFKIQGTLIIQKYNYASILCLLTFTIGLFPFYDPGSYDDDQRWLRALYRIQNVMIGCILGAFGSMVVLPKSTTQILTEQIHRQIRLAGEASEAVLHEAADAFSGALETIDLAHELLETSVQKSQRLDRQASRVSFRAVNKAKVVDRGDKVLETYEAALKDWRVTKGVFGILDYDPFNIGIPQQTQTIFKKETANTLARSLRIQTTVVLLDGIIRNDPHHNFNDDDLELFANSGTLISRMLSLPYNPQRSEEAAIALTQNLHTVRQLIVTNSGKVHSNPSSLPKVDSRESFDTFVMGSQTNLLGLAASKSDDSNDAIDHSGRGVPKFVKGSHVCALLFLQLVEHLILRSLRLYNSWMKVEEIHKDIQSVHENNKLL